MGFLDDVEKGFQRAKNWAFESQEPSGTTVPDYDPATGSTDKFKFRSPSEIRGGGTSRANRFVGAMTPVATGFGNAFIRAGMQNISRATGNPGYAQSSEEIIAGLEQYKNENQLQSFNNRELAFARQEVLDAQKRRTEAAQIHSVRMRRNGVPVPAEAEENPDDFYKKVIKNPNSSKPFDPYDPSTYIDITTEEGRAVLNKVNNDYDQSFINIVSNLAQTGRTFYRDNPLIADTVGNLVTTFYQQMNQRFKNSGLAPTADQVQADNEKAEEWARGRVEHELDVESKESRLKTEDQQREVTERQTLGPLRRREELVTGQPQSANVPMNLKQPASGGASLRGQPPAIPSPLQRSPAEVRANGAGPERAGAPVAPSPQAQLDSVLDKHLGFSHLTEEDFLASAETRSPEEYGALREQRAVSRRYEKVLPSYVNHAKQYVNQVLLFRLLEKGLDKEQLSFRLLVLRFLLKIMRSKLNKIFKSLLISKPLEECLLVI